jgi:hypothetical protein
MVPEGWETSKLLELLKGGIRNGYSPNPPTEPTGRTVLSLSALGPSGLVSSAVKPAPDDESLDSSFKCNV